MKKSQKGFGVIEIMLIIVLVGAVGFTLWQINKTDETVSESEVNASVESTIPTSAEEEPQEEAEESESQEQKEPAQQSDGLLSYSNSSLGISFKYPEAWGSVEQGTFDSNGNYQYFTFTANDDLVFGAPEPDYSTLGRGGAMTDTTGFTKSGDKYTLSSLGTPNPETTAGYAAINNSNADGIVNYNVNFFDTTTYHALFNTNGVTEGINFAGPAAEVNKAEFKALIESVVVS